jgi:hypothetical protein
MGGQRDLERLLQRIFRSDGWEVHNTAHLHISAANVTCGYLRPGGTQFAEGIVCSGERQALRTVTYLNRR